MDFAQAVYDRRSTLGWSAAELAQRAGMPEESVESIEQSGVDPTLELIEMLARALESSFRIDPRGTPGFRFEELREAEPRGAAHEEREEGTRDFRQAW
ncbi:helix-turn-helix transcriptional regulator [Streptomyces sp. ME02-8801-2C]|uniref:helix-turn-helix domain-containing protein n=1 Tax=Streptomyces sp. ME02-8801-2C TaxID=3028680 RepID=UPI0029ADE692|nr:helix-turn-helix transcriptional regulator [Streptomyces sp. ME02-8801-2C]MDX3456956.1 helix-turn-helix transcriptional regulator [Streptomyces sp. ME02-8801-2C]